MELLSGTVLTRDGFIDGYVVIDGGVIVEVSEGRCPGTPVAEGLITAAPVNSHSHCADGGLKVPPGMSLEELVAPPDGLKHRYLDSVPDFELGQSMRRFSELSLNGGYGAFIDFREGGERGCRILRESVPDAVILGRPTSKKYDPDEAESILEASDGIGLPSISDIDACYAESIADDVRRARKMLGIHVSERVREDIDAVLSLDPAFVVHMVESADRDLLKCAEAEVPVVVCARSNAFFGSVPPIKRMIDAGVDVAIGTDNAMLCEPDVRKEASAFLKVLTAQGGDPEAVWRPMLEAGRNILYPAKDIHIRKGAEADVTVFPYSGSMSVRSVLESTDRILRLRRR
ncbi:MAG: deaminase [Candidatus Methanoplasma sp.]|jgi:cytosine/adenosine deaminase-related metal-dependent hydrolase|nr:deaminase [Candidatus Methanoplasma sp.]